MSSYSNPGPGAALPRLTVLSVPATILKEDIPTYCRSGKPDSVAGSLNATPYAIDGVTYPAYRLKFLGFSGKVRVGKPSLYDGVHSFVPFEGDTGDLRAIDFHDLPRSAGE